MTKWVYSFGGGSAEGSRDMRNLLGGKGANLAEMANLGLPVPPGFTISTEACNWFYANGRQMPEGLREQVAEALAKLEKLQGKTLGGAPMPLLLSVRSGARSSMPGMMDTVLNLGLNDESVQALAESADPRFAYDSYRRFIQMYSDVVLGVEHHDFEAILEQEREARGYESDTQLSAEDWQVVIERFKALVIEVNEGPFPQDPQDQLWGAISAVFSSWMNNRAITYRKLHDIPESWGTAVNVQAMVFGNMGDTSATGVAFTRDPSTGEKALYGEFLVNAQGEDVVAGIRTPQYLTEKARVQAGSDAPSLETLMPESFKEFCAHADRLERHYRDMQDMEFTIERGTLWMLQTRNGKRTTHAALKIATGMAEEGLITEEEAVMRIEPTSLDQLLHPTLDPKAERNVIARGLPASPGAASGEIVFTPDKADLLTKEGHPVILVRMETSPEDIQGMVSSRGILTSRGGMTSHAAVVARGMGKPCVCGAGTLKIDHKAGTMMVLGKVYKEGDIITIDGSTGEVMEGAVAMLQPEVSGDFATLMKWADQARRLGVRANAETPEDARAARDFGAEGIGLCRTEHTFFQDDRIVAMREMIVAEDREARRAALAKLLPLQRHDFFELFKTMRGLPVTIRLLDPPLHEFLPKGEKEIEEVAAAIGTEPSRLRERIIELTEANPMLGSRGCRLLLLHPEITEMQTRAILEAARDAAHQTGEPVIPEIMVPLVGMLAELDKVKEVIDRTAEEVNASSEIKITYTVGTMIELPRAALRAREIAQSAQFFSFGTNDLTQTTYGISRDDAASFLGHYQEIGLIEKDPFITLDTEGVGALIALAVKEGRVTKPDLKLGICGEHGGDPASIRFCEEAGLDYVSCSPYRVPVARLAAAQAALGKKATT
ncbi:pyruvate, phosphate dikinase [Afifella marina]|uniref:Pyruvate, phosphate dikinase n=2 Tax=Hyphomicrobiales TaxID=356 RepID=A0A1G5MAE7_AFIMA|nr:pyruvate, phosphate dikinase [Afifella marina]MBK1622714.1 pyruvate, phosphate dikinase [Afifella marina DSM 2698]MBK1625709.1 pyruvate, phosphate dikinase [Afifella marina]MBK5917532.1 pyruvate, phosphate dikinase [Afifella marina]RAI23466.1 pyruvate, phosphate dikinase [Afifella marina DSM 2698]SCZ22153.1 pyruvate phosphate dikinase [Afifella marina DSM 2698]